MSTRDANDDQDRGKLVCKAWDGSRSSEFRTQFLRDFSLGADAKYIRVRSAGLLGNVKIDLERRYHLSGDQID